VPAAEPPGAGCAAAVWAKSGRRDIGILVRGEGAEI